MCQHIFTEDEKNDLKKQRVSFERKSAEIEHFLSGSESSGFDDITLIVEKDAISRSLIESPPPLSNFSATKQAISGVKNGVLQSQLPHGEIKWKSASSPEVRNVDIPLEVDKTFPNEPNSTSTMKQGVTPGPASIFDQDISLQVFIEEDDW